MSKSIINTNSSKHHVQRRVIIGVLVLLLLAGATGSYFYWQSRMNSTNQGDTTMKKLDDDALAVEVNRLMDAKKYDEAQELIKYQDKGSTDPSKIVMQASALAGQGDNTAALKLLEDAATKKDSDEYFYVGHQGRILASIGDTQGAIVKYEAAKDILSKVNIDSSDEHKVLQKASRMADYQTEIDTLKGGQ